MNKFSQMLQIPIFGLCDCNYYGMCILYTYKYDKLYPCDKLIPIGMFEPYILDNNETNKD